MPATLLIKPWNDPVVDTLGHDPRSRYVEQFWLPTLGPTALLLLRHLADRFDRDPDGVELTVVDTSHALGLGQREGSASPIVRTLRRLTQFDLACEDPMSDTVAVRRNVPPVNTAPPPSAPARPAARARRVGRAAARRAAHGRGAAAGPSCRVHAARTGRRPRPRRARAPRHRLPPRAVPRERAVGLPAPPRSTRACAGPSAGCPVKTNPMRGLAS